MMPLWYLLLGPHQTRYHSNIGTSNQLIRPVYVIKDYVFEKMIRKEYC